MATAKELAMIIEAVKRLAQKDEDVRTSVNAHALRGDIPESEVRADIADSQDECCAEKGNGGGENDGPCDTPASDIWCQPDEPWVDCNTGKPIRIFPGGFPQAENCKECEPDDTWQENYYWRVNTYPGYSYGDTPALAVYANGGYPRGGDVIRKITASEYHWDDSFGFAASVVRGSCPPTQDAIDAGFGKCAEKAPENCGDKWNQDGTADLVIIDGCITASKCDPDAGSADQKCNTCRDMCNGSRKIRVCADARTGGFKVEDPNNPGYGSTYDQWGEKKNDYSPPVGS